MRLKTATLIACLLPQAAPAFDTAAGPVEVITMATGLDEPWGIAFVPDGGFLITERDGRLRYFDGAGKDWEVLGVPDVRAEGQGGLLDVMVPRDFETSREIFLSYSAPQGGGAGTALAEGRVDPSYARLEDVRVIFEMVAGTTGGRHFGSRIVEAPDGSLFLTIGDRGDRPAAQDLSRVNGSVIRVNRDGSVPVDNPFADASGVRPEIYSYGHRNPQGAALDAAGRLWLNEHGASGGDEVNLVEPGQNYGWPVISYGKHYSGAKIGEGTEKPGMVQPLHYWDPSIAPSGMIVYSGKLWPEWEGDLFVGSLKFGLISRLEVAGRIVNEAERFEADETARVRDIVEAPDGSIWFLSVGQGSAYKMTPG